MPRHFRAQKRKGHVRIPRRTLVTSRDQYGKSGRGIAVCGRCHAVLFRKEWRKPDRVIKVGRHSRGDIHLILCPACKMIQEGLFEGELCITNVPAKFNMELVNLISAFGKRACGRDSQHRVIETVRQGRGAYRVTTTENQLAVQLAKKIKRVFNKVDLHISYSREPYEVNRIGVRFQKR